MKSPRFREPEFPKPTASQSSLPGLTAPASSSIANASHELRTPLFSNGCGTFAAAIGSDSQPLPQANDAPSLRLDFFGLRFARILERPSRRRGRPVLRLVEFRSPAADVSQNGRDREADKQREDEKRSNADRNPDPDGHLSEFDAAATESLLSRTSGLVKRGR